jgi:hypothetical protein
MASVATSSRGYSGVINHKQAYLQQALPQVNSRFGRLFYLDVQIEWNTATSTRPVLLGPVQATSGH